MIAYTSKRACLCIYCLKSQSCIYIYPIAWNLHICHSKIQDFHICFWCLKIAYVSLQLDGSPKICNLGMGYCTHTLPVWYGTGWYDMVCIRTKVAPELFFFTFYLGTRWCRSVCTLVCLGTGQYIPRWLGMPRYLTVQDLYQLDYELCTCSNVVPY